MSEYIEIAYAAATHRLCFLTGTGFSKAVSDGKAPSWQSLLEQLCDLLKDGDSLKKELFPDGKAKDLSLEEAAQIIALKFILSGKNIYHEIEKIISSVEPDNFIEYIPDFFKNNTFKVITTNYDKLAEKLAGENRTCTITPGLPIPKYNCDVKVYHVHGSIDSPSDMV
ncbi:SIR2 family protein, partial [Escherichia coli]